MRHISDERLPTTSHKEKGKGRATRQMTVKGKRDTRMQMKRRRPRIAPLQIKWSAGGILNSRSALLQ
eukprot:8363599-Pyramimonas_sp.AAC.2